MKRSTLRDVAKLSQLSVGTVSSYINGKKISDKNREKISRAIEILQYTPNPSARTLASGKSHSVLLYVLERAPISSSTWLHALPIIQGISDVATEHGYRLEIEIQPLTAKEYNIQNLRTRTRNNSVDGMLLFTAWELDEAINHLLKERDFPYILLGLGNTTSSCCSVDFDNYHPIYEIVEHLAKLGHTKLALLGGFQHQTHMKLREKGFRDAVRDLGLECRENWVRYGDYSLDSGIELMDSLLKDVSNAPTAVVCGNDFIAAGAIHSIQQHGLRVPDDIAVSGFDDTIITTAVTPAITSVKVPSYDMGTKAMMELLAKIKDQMYAVPATLIQSQCIFRSSTAKGPSKSVK